jgi:hypothetical protein
MEDESSWRFVADTPQAKPDQQQSGPLVHNYRGCDVMQEQSSALRLELRQHLLQQVGAEVAQAAPLLQGNGT